MINIRLVRLLVSPALSKNSNDLQLLTFVTKGTILDAAWVPGLPMPKATKVEHNTYGLQ